MLPASPHSVWEMTSQWDGSPLETLAAGTPQRENVKVPSDHGRLAFDSPILGEERSHVHEKQAVREAIEFWNVDTLGLCFDIFGGKQKEGKRTHIYYGASSVPGEFIFHVRKLGPRVSQSLAPGPRAAGALQTGNLTQ